MRLRVSTFTPSLVCCCCYLVFVSFLLNFSCSISVLSESEFTKPPSNGSPEHNNSRFGMCFWVVPYISGLYHRFPGCIFLPSRG